MSTSMEDVILSDKAFLYYLVSGKRIPEHNISNMEQQGYSVQEIEEWLANPQINYVKLLDQSSDVTNLREHLISYLDEHNPGFVLFLLENNQFMQEIINKDSLLNSNIFSLYKNFIAGKTDSDPIKMSYQRLLKVPDNFKQVFSKLLSSMQFNQDLATYLREVFSIIHSNFTIKDIQDFKSQVKTKAGQKFYDEIEAEFNKHSKQAALSKKMLLKRAMTAFNTLVRNMITTDKAFALHLNNFIEKGQDNQLYNFKSGLEDPNLDVRDLTAALTSTSTLKMTGVADKALGYIYENNIAVSLMLMQDPTLFHSIVGVYNKHSVAITQARLAKNNLDLANKFNERYADILATSEDSAELFAALIYFSKYHDGFKWLIDTQDLSYFKDPRTSLQDQLNKIPDKTMKAKLYFGSY